MTPDWNLIRLMLLDVVSRDEERSMVIHAGHTPESILAHYRYIVDSGMILVPEVPDGIFEPGFTTATVLTEKGRRFLETTGGQSSTVQRSG